MQASVLNRRVAAFICGAFLLAAPVLAETVKGNGVIRTQARAASGFSAIGLGIPAQVEVKQGDSEGLTVEADENLLPLIETRVENGSLQITAARRNLDLESKSIRIVVQMPQVEGLGVGGSGTITADALKANGLKLDIGGSGAIRIGRLQAERVSMAIGGTGRIQAAGAANHVSVSIGGSGNVDAPALVADEAQVSVAGSGDTALGVRSLLVVGIAGSGNVKYRGDPAVQQSITGSGRVRRVGALPQ